MSTNSEIQVAAINDELTKRAGWHPQSRGRGYGGLCNAGSHSQLVNVPCETARHLAWLYDLLEHPLGPCPECKGHGWNWGDGTDEFNKVGCARCAESGLRGTSENALIVPPQD